VLLLDIALEQWLRVLLERQEKSSLDGDALVELVGLALDSACIAGESAELGQVGSLHLLPRVISAIGTVTVIAWACARQRLRRRQHEQARPGRRLSAGGPRN